MWLVSSAFRVYELMCVFVMFFFFFQAEDGIRDLVRSRGLGDVYKRQHGGYADVPGEVSEQVFRCHTSKRRQPTAEIVHHAVSYTHLTLPTFYSV